MTVELRLHSPAKINLFLQICGKRPDGYHELASLFQTISLCDVLTFSFADEDVLKCSYAKVPLDSSNLIWKAAHLFRQKMGISSRLHIHLEKQIPLEAGLGGGSSNAATTLWAMNELSGRPASSQQLMEWGAEIGSDVPFFFSSGTAFCTGRGEKVQSLLPVSSEPLWIVKPPLGLSTAAVYKKIDLDRLSQCDPLQHLHSFLEGNPCYFNDLEPAAFSVAKELQAYKQDLLESGFSTVLLCGSGSAFFCRGNSTRRFKGIPVHFLNRSTSWYTNV